MFFKNFPFQFSCQPYPNNGDVNTGGYSHLWFCSPSYHLYTLSVSVLATCLLNVSGRPLQQHRPQQQQQQPTVVRANNLDRRKINAKVCLNAFA